MSEYKQRSQGEFRRSFNQEPREMFDAVCDKCGAAIKLPFKPDGVRKVFCREHMIQKSRFKY